MDNVVYIDAIFKSLQHKFKINEALYDDVKLLSKSRAIIHQYHNIPFSTDLFHYTLNQLIHNGSIKTYTFNSIVRYMTNEYFHHLIAVKVLATMHTTN